MIMNIIVIIIIIIFIIVIIDYNNTITIHHNQRYTGWNKNASIKDSLHEDGSSCKMPKKRLGFLAYNNSEAYHTKICNTYRHRKFSTTLTIVFYHSFLSCKAT
jgi:hypothetical protein